MTYGYGAKSAKLRLLIAKPTFFFPALFKVFIISTFEHRIGLLIRPLLMSAKQVRNVQVEWICYLIKKFD